MRRIAFALLACLACHQSRAGSIGYDFDDLHGYAYGHLDIDDAALGRGHIVQADVRGFWFTTYLFPDVKLLFDSATLPAEIPIDGSGIPTGINTWLTSSKNVGGVEFDLAVNFTVASFERFDGQYVTTIPGNVRVGAGGGYWTTDATPTPEPSSIAMGMVGMVAVGMVASRRRLTRKNPGPGLT
jgi:hypothetical protein